MNQIETSAFFRALHNIEAIDANSSDLYIEGYEFVMDDVRFAIMSGDVKNMYALDEFVNHMDAYAEDNEPGDYARGYQDAVNVCLAALSQLLEPTAA
jgi:predicted Ser/Thr protein kinase